MEILQIFLLLLVVFLSMVWYLRMKRKNQFSDDTPTMRDLPFIVKNRHRINDIVTGMFHSLGDTFRVKIPPFTSMNHVVTCKPQNIEYIFKTNFANFPKGSDFIDVVDIFGDGLFATDSYLQQWRISRKALHNCLTSKSFRSFVANVSQWEVQSALLPLLEHLAKEGSVVDLQDVFVRLTYDSGFNMVFGKTCKLLQESFPVNELADAMDVVMETTVCRLVVPKTLWKSLRWLKVGWERRYSEAWRTIDHVLEGMILVKKEEMSKGVEANDLLSICMKYQEEDMNNKFLRDFAFNVFFAASDTTASGLTGFFWLVSQTPVVEEKILEELKHVVVSDKSKTSKMKMFDQEDVKRSVYLHAAICEALRLHPPIPVNYRAALKGDVLPDGTRLGPGTKVIVSIYAVGRSKSIWGDDCMDFRPERWINEDGKLRSELMSKFFIFNLGPRSCMGQDIAFNFMKMVIATILFNFHVQVVECEPHSLKMSMVQLMNNGLKVKIRKRIA